jgi:hypothetical protein
MASKRATAKPRQPGQWSSLNTRWSGLYDHEITMLDELAAQGRLLVRIVESGKFIDSYISPIVGARRVDATVYEQGNFTVAVLKVTDRRGKKHELVGMSKCNPRDDEYDEGRGRRVALARAARGEAVRV